MSTPLLLEVVRGGPVHRIRLPSPTRGHALDDIGLDALCGALRESARDASSRIVALEGSAGTFCIGMDLDAATGRGTRSFTPRKYADTLALVAEVGVVVVAVVDGRALGGGVGLAAACDLVFATPRATFALPEALLGLVPAIASPPLVRRVGFQRAYRLALTTEPVDAARALALALVDEVHENPEDGLRRLARRLRHVEPAAIAAIKAHFRRVHRAPDEAEELAIERLDALLASAAVRERIAAVAASE
ncbi:MULTISPECIES: enoyl-CoA hydratase-related protein [Sandaracinus]|uniref:enoyl-CoA hydratase-related protein n=1 Tax=Sandaracinus TaxID=1055688 RepID=UPI0019D4AC39|nr:MULTISPECIES: enoyl-CoA hydratase-related protein [Sandaracinus]QRN75762.1 Enoyl-CoA hydratase/isomerase [Sandaracinus sp.]UJR87262.1 Polyketide biosynthesis enoyl-CoA hydratase PksH [Sandaracinus amylolyticus]